MERFTRRILSLFISGVFGILIGFWFQFRTLEYDRDVLSLMLILGILFYDILKYKFIDRKDETH